MVEMACDGAVVRLTMNAPDRLNALSDEMLAALQARLDEIAHRPIYGSSSLPGRARRSAPAMI